MRLVPFGMLPSVELEVFAWREDAQEWMRAHDLNALDLVDGSDRGAGHYVIDGDVPTCLIWFDVNPATFTVTNFSGGVAAECLRLVRHVYAPFFSETTPSDDILCPLLCDFTSATMCGVSAALIAALDVYKDRPYGIIPRDELWVSPLPATEHHVPSNWEMIHIYQSWQLGLTPIELSERYGVDDELIMNECLSIRRFARRLGLRTV
jgi:hypothetical protein